MGLLQVDESLCRRDGICAAECPRRIIDFDEAEGYPSITPENEGFCMACGHCVAVCPHGAVSVTGIPVEACPTVDPSLRLSEAQVVQFLRSRRSIRVYRKQEVERETLQHLIEIARYAPTASNSQTVHWTVVTGRDKLRRFSEMTIGWMRSFLENQPGSAAAARFQPYVAEWDEGYDGILRNAPHLVVASAPKESANGLVDCAIALSYLEFAALPLGVGTCWAGLLQAALLHWPGARETVGLPEGHTHHYPMMLGYPKFPYQRLPERNEPPITWK